MTKLGRATTIRLLVCAMLVLAATAWAQTLPPIAEQMAKTYGLDAFGQIEAIRYTFNAQFPGVNVSRSWVWQPKGLWEIKLAIPCYTPGLLIREVGQWN